MELDSLINSMSNVSLETCEERTKVLYDSIKNSIDIISIYDPSIKTINKMHYMCNQALERYTYYINNLHAYDWDNLQLVNYIRKYCEPDTTVTYTLQQRYLLMQVIDLQIYRSITINKEQ